LVRRFWFGATMELGRSMMMSAGAGAARPTGSSTTDRKICSTDDESLLWAKFGIGDIHQQRGDLGAALAVGCIAESAALPCFSPENRDIFQEKQGGD
jgi:hypothetical protein